MLSAVAARKAAQAAKAQPPAPIVLHTPTNNVDKEISDDELLLQSTPSPKSATFKSKRKPSAAIDRDNSTIKKKKLARSGAQKNRYFDTPAKVAQSKPRSTRDEKVEVDDGDDDTSSDTDEEAIQPPGPTSIGRNGNRAWSPSQQLNGTPRSGSDFDNDDQTRPSNFYQTNFQSNTNGKRGHESIPLSTFSPQLGLNTFPVDRGEVVRITGESEIDSNGTLVVLHDGITIALVGTYTFNLIYGSISTQGSILLPSPDVTHRVFALKCSPIPSLHAKSLLETPATDGRSLLPKQVSQFVQDDSVVLLIRPLLSGIEGLGRICSSFQSSFNFDGTELDNLGISSARLVTSSRPDLQAYYTPTTWENAITTALSSLETSSDAHDNANPDLSVTPSIHAIRGPKRTGKSSFSRALLNRLLRYYRRVAYLECDIGQTEFTPPGMVSLNIVEQPLFGPSFTHHAIPYKSHFIGSTSPRNCPDRYLHAIHALVQDYRLDVQFPDVSASSSNDGRNAEIIPLVVNTMGWTKGLGADLSERLEEIVQPTHVYFTQNTSGEMDLYPDPKDQSRYRSSSTSEQGGNAMFELEAIPVEMQNSKLSPSDWRTISLMSYFHSIVSPQHSDISGFNSPNDFTHCCFSTQLWSTNKRLTEQRPFLVTLKNAIDQVILVGNSSDDVVIEEVPRVLNGSIVALVSCQPGTIDIPPKNDGSSFIPYVQGATPPDPQTSNCIGLALIRGVSPSLLPIGQPTDVLSTDALDALHIITPIPMSLVKSSNARCLVKGDIELPIWGMLEEKDASEKGAGQGRFQDRSNVPYLQWRKGDVAIGSERRRVRRNIMRRAQL